MHASSSDAGPLPQGAGGADDLQRFLDASPYRLLVERKKLAFVYQSVAETADRLAVPRERLSILEAGCGRGGITLPLASLGCAVDAFDLDPQAVAALRAVCAQKGWTQVRLQQADARTFGCERTYDLVIASEVLEHLDLPEAAVTVLARCLAPDGSLLVTVPNGYGPWELSRRFHPLLRMKQCNWLRRKMGKPPLDFQSGAFHRQFFTIPRLERLMLAESLHLVRRRNSDSIFAAWEWGRRRWPGLERADLSLADRWPAWMASGWFFEFRRQEGIGRER